MSGGGSPHLHSKFVHGCFRCEISRDELWRAMVEEVRGLEAKLAAVRALVVAQWVDHPPQASLPRSILAILDGPTP